MKKNLNIIQIKGFKGILYLLLIGCCLTAGFGWFPGWVCMNLWNITSSHIEQMPLIGIVQGMLLWGIIAASYFTFRKDKPVICMKASEGLNEEELKAIFADIKKQAQNDTILQNMLKAREAELKIKNLSESNIPGTNCTDIKDVHIIKNNNNEQTEKIETK